MTTQAQLTHEVGHDGEGSNTETAERGGGGDVSVEFLHHGGVTVTTHHHLLVF